MACSKDGNGNGTGPPDDLPVVVDATGFAAIVSAQGAEVLHRTAAVQEGMVFAIGEIGIPDDLSAVVDAIGPALGFRPSCRGRSRYR